VLAVDVLGRGEGWVGYLNTVYGLGGICAGVAGMGLVGRRLVPRASSPSSWWVPGSG